MSHLEIWTSSNLILFDLQQLLRPYQKMSTAAVFGCTGAVGSKILDTLLTTDVFAQVKTISRRAPKTANSPPKLEAIIESDTAKWSPLLSTLKPTPSIVFNAVGTTRAAAGGIQNQWKIDYDLCIENAKAAKAAGVRTYVFISSAGTRGLLSGYVPYSKMKVGVEDAIKEIGFEQAIILRPGAILGEREVPKAPLFEKLMENLDKVSVALKDRMGKGFFFFLVFFFPAPLCIKSRNSQLTLIQVRTNYTLEGPLWLLRRLRRRARLRLSTGSLRVMIFSRWVGMNGNSDMPMGPRRLCAHSV